MASGALATFSLSRIAGKTQSATLYLDYGLTQLAPIFTHSQNNPAGAGIPIVGSQLNADENGVWPLFLSVASVLYYRTDDGRIRTLVPTPTQNPPTVSGSRGGGAALPALLTALAQQGIITDGTSA